MCASGCRHVSPPRGTVPDGPPRERPVDSFTDDQLLDLMTAFGFEPEPAGEGALTFELGPALVMLFNQWDGDLQLYYVMTGGTWSHELINEWNKTRRLTRSYLDEDGNVILESDLLSLGGMTERQVGSFVAMFHKALDLFLIEVVGPGMDADPRWHLEPPPEEPSESAPEGWH